MAYVHWQQDVTLVTSAGDYKHALNASGFKGTWAPGYQPVYLKACWVTNLTTLAMTTTGPIIDFYVNSSPGLTATGNMTLVETVFFATGQSAVIGKTAITDNVGAVASKCSPGQEICAIVRNATTEAVLARIGVYVEAVTEEPTNNTAVFRSA